MHALIMTAGLGTRLDPLTRMVAKPAMPLGDRAIVEHVIAWLRREHVSDLVLNLHHLPATVAAVVGDGQHLGVRARYSWEQPVLGSAGGPRHALALLDSDPFLIVNGDTLCDFDLTPMIAAHARSSADVTMAVVPNPAPDHYNGILVDDDGWIRGFVPKGRADGSWHFVGVQVAQRRTFAHLADGVVAETVAGFYRELAAAPPGRLAAWRAPTGFLDVGTPRDYLEAARSHPSERPHPGIAPSAVVTDSIVWPAASVGERARLHRCIVTDSIAVPAGFTATAAVLVPAGLARPGDTARIEDGIGIFPL